MISVFNGRSRTLGGGQSNVFAQIDVGFRECLHYLKGARLHVFLAIALHTNEDGWAWPSYDTLQRETGYGRDTIATALDDLCKLRIGGHRVLLRFQPVGSDGQFMSNRYLIFPSEEEVRQYEPTEPKPEPVHTDPKTRFDAADLPCMENPNTDNPEAENTYSNQNPEENHNQIKAGGGFNQNTEAEQLPIPPDAYYSPAVYSALCACNISETKARLIAAMPGVTCDIVDAWIDEISTWYPTDDTETAKNRRRGALVNRLVAGEVPPEPDREPAYLDTSRYVQGEFGAIIEH